MQSFAPTARSIPAVSIGRAPIFRISAKPKDWFAR